MNKLLVLGSTGFMGKNIAEYFSFKDYEVFGTSFTSLDFPKKTKVYTVNLTLETHVSELFSNIKPDIVINAAAVTSGSKDIIECPYIHVTDNAIINSLILRACYNYNVKHFIFLSCGVMYKPGEKSRKETDFNEHDEIYPSYFGVGWTKVYIEKMCEFYSRFGRTKHTVIRHSNTYGPYDKFDLDKGHVVGATIKKVMNSKDGDDIVVWGTGKETYRDLIYVEDVCDFIYRSVNYQKSNYLLCNVSFGKSLSIEDIVKTIIDISGKKLNIIYDTSKPRIPTKLTLDNTKAFNEFGWTPKIDFKEGIKKTINWYNYCQL